MSLIWHRHPPPPGCQGTVARKKGASSPQPPHRAALYSAMSDRVVSKIGKCVQAQVKEAEDSADAVLDVLLTDLNSLVDQSVLEELRENQSERCLGV